MRLRTRFASLLALVAVTATAAAGEIEPVNSTALEKAANDKAVREHITKLQEIANKSRHNRAAGTTGYRRSADYVESVLLKAGLTPVEQAFDVTTFVEVSKSLFEQTKPEKKAFVADTDFDTLEYSAAGDVTARIALARHISIPPSGEPGTTTSGCAKSDFGSTVKGRIVLIQRGTCTFAEKVANAAAAGAVAAVIFNEGQAGRTGVLDGTLGEAAAIPAIGASYDLGKALYTAKKGGADVTLHIKIDSKIQKVKTFNILADRPGTRSDRVVLVGAHLDSVNDGPGINDNGTGTAQLLATAVGLNTLGIKTENTLRFAFWGAEEAGLIGSTTYVGSLPKAELDKIMLTLNFDMIGSPNYGRFIYDGDGTLGTAGPRGSAAIEHVFEAWFAKKKLATEPTAFDGRSDYYAFIENGIPAGGLFSGAEEEKSGRQFFLFGGTPWEPFDSCYHKACDTSRNVNYKAVRELGGAANNAILTFAQTKEDVRITVREKGASTSGAAAAADWRGGHLIR